VTLPAPSYRLATAADTDDVLALQRDFYAEEGYPFAAEQMRPALATLLSDPALGQVWVAVQAQRIVAYAVLTLGYSLEHHGRDAFVDELYVVPAHRSQGLGRAALALMDTYCREHYVHVLLLEVEHVNDEAHALYRRAGFATGTRHLLKKYIG
jgi:ribosomal protein S18 acetylase RimI-like enzyme